MNFIIAMIRYVSPIRSNKIINATAYRGDIAINRYYDIH